MTEQINNRHQSMCDHAWDFAKKFAITSVGALAYWQNNQCLLNNQNTITRYITAPKDLLPSALQSVVKNCIYRPMHALEDITCVGSSWLFQPPSYARNISHIFVEECIFRVVLQSILLPHLAKKLPERFAPFLKHPLVRIALTSAVYSVARLHLDQAWKSPMPAIYALTQGFILGTTTELVGIEKGWGLGIPVAIRQILL